MRSVYFSFHYEDVFKVNIIRNSGIVGGSRSAGFVDRSLWEKAKNTNSAALRKLIEDGLNGTSVTVVLIGEDTASRKWVNYEIERSVARGNALLGIHINKVGRATRRSAVPKVLVQRGAAIYEWTNVRDFAEWVEEAWRLQNDPSMWDRVAEWLRS